MSDPVAYFALGTELKIGNGAEPEVFSTIPGVGPITGPGQTRDTIDVTSHSSVGGYREYIPGLRDSEEVTADINWLWDDDAQNALEAAFDSDLPTNFQIVYPFTPLNETDNFTGFVTNLGKTSPTDAQATRSMTIKITGPVTRSNDDD